MEYQGVLGIVAISSFCYLLSENRKAYPWRILATGITLQFALAYLLTGVPAVRELISGLNSLVLALERATQDGTSLLFGYLGGGPLPFEEPYVGASYIFAFRALPLVLVISALSALLFHLKILPLFVRGFGFLLRRTMGIGGAAGIAAAANVFVGMVEAPLLIRPYLSSMSRSELFLVMTCGMSTIAGTMLAVYASVLSPVLPDALGQILTASLISAPAAIMISLMLIPQGQPATEGAITPEELDGSAMDAIVRGTSDGLKLLLNIMAMLIVLIAFVSIVNQILGLFPAFKGNDLSLQRLLGWVFAPLTWLIGVPWDQAPVAGALMGSKTILNEFVAYLDLAALPAEALGQKSRLIMTYALCGFANLGSLGIMIGGLGAMAPERRGEIIALGGKSVLAGTLATSFTGAVIGLI